MNRIHISAILIAMMFISGLLAGEFMGISRHCVGNTCVTSASTTISNMAFAIIILLFVLFHPQTSPQVRPVSNFGTLHKFMSFFLDFMVVMLLVSPYGALPLLIKESSHTGYFSWSFQRDFSRGSDSVYFAISFITIILIIAYYFYQHKKIKKPTIGQYMISGIK